MPPFQDAASAESFLELLPPLFCRTPETCTMGALGEYLHSRFKLRKEQLPEPGSKELESLYLFPGQNASKT